MKRTILTIALLLGVSSVHAYYRTGNHLLEGLKACETAELYKCSEARGLILGASDTIELFYHVGINSFGVTLPASCPPDGVTAGQLTAVVKQFLENHPEQLHEGAVMLVHNALIKAFPCE